MSQKCRIINDLLEIEAGKDSEFGEKYYAESDRVKIMKFYLPLFHKQQ